MTSQLLACQDNVWGSYGICHYHLSLHPNSVVTPTGLCLAWCACCSLATCMRDPQPLRETFCRGHTLPLAFAVRYTGQTFHHHHHISIHSILLFGAFYCREPWPVMCRDQARDRARWRWRIVTYLLSLWMCVVGPLCFLIVRTPAGEHVKSTVS